MLLCPSNAAATRPVGFRALLLASIAALVLASFDAAPAAAQPTAASGHELAPADATEFGARKRARARRGNPAAGLAVMGMMIGTIGAVIAAQQRRDAYESAYNRRVYGYRYGYPYGYPYGDVKPYVHPHHYHPHHRRHYHHHPHGPRIGW